MRYRIKIPDDRQLLNVAAALQIVDPRAEVVAPDETAAMLLVIDYDQSSDLMVKVCAPELGASGNWEYRDREIADPRYSPADRRQRLKELIRLGVIRVVGDYCHRRPPWGILSGVRPTKIYHYLRDKGFTAPEIRRQLTAVYGLASDKTALLLEVGAGQKPFFKPPKVIGIYVGIPFCPTRCHYCSFAAVSLETHSHLVPAFLTALEWEVRMIRDLCRELDLTVESIYIGGGTPTSLGETDFCRMLDWVGRAFYSDLTREFTVEAGRPETITPAKLTAMVRAGVTRVSVNPQTMQARTLKLIGRAHTVEQARQAVSLVKREPLALNMDLILGLPGETGADFGDSLAQVLALQPDNLTIHTLAPKRAASWRKNFARLDLARDQELQTVSRQALELLRQAGYAPYYLYRQRAILAGLENIGYTLPGQAGIYNIQMMEERQSILGLGGGAVTKWVVGPDHQVGRHQNSKCPAGYSQRIHADVATKMRQTRLYFCR
ncbi:MAG: coproporphyrinogen dehydrogenase HemZ [Bacillota bacterium]|jgi:oxygen-independent coproporphyrinogen-3 oxidase